MLIEVSQASRASGPEASGTGSPRMASQNSLPPAANPIAPQATAIRSVTAGPASAIRSSTPGESESRFRRASPPNIQSVMSEISMSLRIATKAWPSSCSRIEAKKRIALITAST